MDILFLWIQKAYIFSNVSYIIYNIMRIKKFYENVNNDSDLIERLKDSLISLSDEREVSVDLNRSIRKNKILGIYFNIRIDDLICLDKRVLFTSNETKLGFNTFSNTILNILESIKESLERCEIDYEYIDFEISSTSYNNDVDIPQTLFVRAVMN